MDDFDFLISKYSDDLMQMKDKWSKWGIVTEEKKEETTSAEAIPAVAMTEETPVEEAPTPEEEPAEEAEPQAEEFSTPEEAPAPEEAPDNNETVPNDYPKANPENYATFTARVFSGDEAFPIEGAKVMIYREKNLHTFLITNENGETATVKIESAPAENALIPNSENQEIDYTADVYADGFTPRKGLFVSAVGDSQILLTVQLTPLSERID